MFFVYALSSVNRNYIYVGLTSDIERRIFDHNQGYNPTTKPYRPFKTILIEEYNSRQQAREREKYLKSGVGKEYLKQLILSTPTVL
jgi:putative endonuclease